MSTDYAITIKCIQKDCWASQLTLEELYSDCVSFYHGEKGNYTFEKDSMGRQHLHGMFKARKNLMVTRYKKPYAHIYIDLLRCERDVMTWMRYMYKDDYQKFIDDLYDGKYMFLD